MFGCFRHLWSLNHRLPVIWEALEGLESSGRLAGTNSTYFHPDPSSGCRVETKKQKVLLSSPFRCFPSFLVDVAPGTLRNMCGNLLGSISISLMQIGARAAELWQKRGGTFWIRMVDIKISRYRISNCSPQIPSPNHPRIPSPIPPTPKQILPNPLIR